jgi:hypothetical protein
VQSSRIVSLKSQEDRHAWTRSLHVINMQIDTFHRGSKGLCLGLPVQKVVIASLTQRSIQIAPHCIAAKLLCCSANYFLPSVAPSSVKKLKPTKHSALANKSYQEPPRLKGLVCTSGAASERTIATDCTHSIECVIISSLDIIQLQSSHASRSLPELRRDFIQVNYELHKLKSR